ncbi:MAG: hypothetical protein ACRD22_19500 [Terriglobia bacterium]
MDSADTKSQKSDPLSDQLQKALDNLRPGFQADGMDLKLGAIDPAGTVEVKIVMGPNACEECLLPPETLAKMFLAAMRHVISSVTCVDVTVDRSAGN